MLTCAPVSTKLKIRRKKLLGKWRRPVWHWWETDERPLAYSMVVGTIYLTPKRRTQTEDSRTARTLLLSLISYSWSNARCLSPCHDVMCSLDYHVWSEHTKETWISCWSLALCICFFESYTRVIFHNGYSRDALRLGAALDCGDPGRLFIYAPSCSWHMTEQTHSKHWSQKKNVVPWVKLPHLGAPLVVFQYYFFLIACSLRYGC